MSTLGLTPSAVERESIGPLKQQQRLDDVLRVYPCSIQMILNFLHVTHERYDPTQIRGCASAARSRRVQSRTSTPSLTCTTGGFITGNPAPRPDRPRRCTGNRPACRFATSFNQCNGMLGKAVRIRHCPATVSACSCVCFTMTQKRPGQSATGATASGRRPGFVLPALVPENGARVRRPVLLAELVVVDRLFYRVPEGERRRP